MALVEIEIPPNALYVGVARLAVAALARGAGIDEDRVEELKIAAGEACTNAVLANEGSGAPVSITWVEEPGQVTLEVADRGSPYDPSAAEDRLAMSLALLESLVDDCDVAPRDGGGMRARLTLARPSG